MTTRQAQRSGDDPGAPGNTPVHNGARVGGALLVAAPLIGLVALGILIVSGALPAFSSLLRGSLAELAPHVHAFRWSTFLYATAWLAQLGGFLLLTRVLVRTGDQHLAVVAMALTGVAAVLGILEATFAVEVTTWAAEEAATTGTTPQLYTPLENWLDSIQAVYITLGLGAQAGFGSALFTTRVLPTWIGLTTMAWAAFWLVGFFAAFPAVLFVMPAVIGMALLQPGATHPRHTKPQPEDESGDRNEPGDRTRRGQVRMAHPPRGERLFCPNGVGWFFSGPQATVGNPTGYIG